MKTNGTHPIPRSTRIRRHRNGKATVQLIFGKDQARVCRRCPARCKARPIEEAGSVVRCGHRIPQDRVRGFLFPNPAPSDHERRDADDSAVQSGLDVATLQRETMATLRCELVRSRPPHAEFSAASCIAVDLGGRGYLVCAWTEADWECEDHRPSNVWPINGGGRLHIMPMRKPGEPPIPALHPLAGPSSRCPWPRWLDVTFDPGVTPPIYQFSFWPHNSSERPDSAFLADGDGEFTFIGVALMPLQYPRE